MSQVNWKQAAQLSIKGWTNLMSVAALGVCLYGCSAQPIRDSSPVASSETITTELRSVDMVARMPKSDLGGYLAGHYARSVFDPEAAAEFFRRTLNSDPRNPEILHQLLVALVAQGNLQESMALSQDLILNNGSEPLALLILAAGRVK